MSGRHHQFKKRATTLSASPIGCPPRRSSVSRHLIRHLSEMSRPFPSLFAQGFASCPFWLDTAPAAHSWAVSHWQWDVSWAGAQALWRCPRSGCRMGGGDALRWLAAGGFRTLPTAGAERPGWSGAGGGGSGHRPPVWGAARGRSHGGEIL